MATRFLAMIAIVAATLSTASQMARAVGSATEFLEMIPEFREANRLIKEQSFQAAIELLLKLDAANPREPTILNLIGFSFRKLKNYPEAKRYYDSALKIDEYHRPTLEYQGMWFIDNGDRAGAAANLAKLRRICADCVETKDLAKALETGQTH